MYVVAIFSIVTVLLLLYYCWPFFHNILPLRIITSVLRKCWQNLIQGKDEEPFIGVQYGEGLRRELLLKRCEQSSTKTIEDSIIAKLKHDSSVPIVEKPWQRVQDDGRKPVLVFCVISSRIGTDIENAMRGIHGNSPVVLVLLHCKLSSLLRGDLSDEEELLDTTLRNRMTGIAHFAFSDREGLYDCRQNEIGFGKMNSLAMKCLGSRLPCT